jgi:hypothetical protein
MPERFLTLEQILGPNELFCIDLTPYVCSVKSPDDTFRLLHARCGTIWLGLFAA